MFIIMAVVLPLQLYVVLTNGNLYPCIHLPGFQPILDDTANIYYTDKNLFALKPSGERIPIKYAELFDILPEYFARHTMNHLFVATDSSHTIVLDRETQNWVYERLKQLTGTEELDFLEVETLGYQYDKASPRNPTLIVQQTLFLSLYE